MYHFWHQLTMPLSTWEDANFRWSRHRFLMSLVTLAIWEADVTGVFSTCVVKSSKLFSLQNVYTHEKAYTPTHKFGFVGRICRTEQRAIV